MLLCFFDDLDPPTYADVAHTPVQERLDLLREQQKAAEVAECTFKPRINRNSDTLMNERAETLKVRGTSIRSHDRRPRPEPPYSLPCRNCPN